MVGTLLGTAAATFAAVFAIAGHALASLKATGTATPFGGPVPVRVAHIGRIDIDLARPGGGTLRRVHCVGATAASRCFVAR